MKLRIFEIKHENSDASTQTRTKIINMTYLFTAGFQNSTEYVFSSIILGTKLNTNLTIRYLKILTKITVIWHEGEIAIVRNIGQLVIFTFNMGYIHVVSRGAYIFVLFAWQTKTIIQTYKIEIINKRTFIHLRKCRFLLNGL